MANYAVGIDFGTSTSKICIYQEPEPYLVPDPGTQSPIVPSQVAVNKWGELLVGEDARSWVDIKGSGVREVMRMLGTGETVVLGGKEYRPEEIASLILRRLRENAESLLGVEIREVVLSIPTNFSESSRKATLQAATLAGLDVLRLINEPTAVALAFGVKNLNPEEQVVVFDFGDGTLDVTVLEMVGGVLHVESSFGEPRLGGKDVDEAVQELLLRKFKDEFPVAVIPDESASVLRAVAETTKVALLSQLSFLVRVSSFAMAAGGLVDFEVEVSRQEFEEAISPLLERARNCLVDALAARRIKAEAVDCVLLTGATTYIPAVRELVADVFGKEPKSDVNPDLAVAIGASVQAAHIKGLIPAESGVTRTEVCSYGFGVDRPAEGGNQKTVIYEPLMRPNTMLPYSVKKHYMIRPDQRAVNFNLYQDPTGKALLPADAIDTGISVVISDIPAGLHGESRLLEVEFSIDLNGVISIKAGMGKSCSRCGAQLGDGMEFCTICGVGVDSSSTFPSDQDSTTDRMLALICRF